MANFNPPVNPIASDPVPPSPEKITEAKEALALAEKTFATLRERLADAEDKAVELEEAAADAAVDAIALEEPALFEIADAAADKGHAEVKKLKLAVESAERRVNEAKLHVTRTVFLKHKIDLEKLGEKMLAKSVALENALAELRRQIPILSGELFGVVWRLAGTIARRDGQSQEYQILIHANSIGCRQGRIGRRARPVAPTCSPALRRSVMWPSSANRTR